jgi:hypothetical protein
MSESIQPAEAGQPSKPYTDPQPPIEGDIEKMIGGDYAQLTNTNIRSFGWKGVTVTVKDRQSQQPKTILSDINGIVKAGELLALMGPSYVIFH